MNENTARTDELKRLIRMLVEEINDERKLRELYLFMNRLVCR